MEFPSPNAAPVIFTVTRVDLYFFYDIDIAILVVEISTDDIPLPQIQNSLFRFGRCYPTYWERDQGETMVRLTVVATIGLIGVATTGVPGMNLFAPGKEPALTRGSYFLLVLIPIIAVPLLQH